MINKKEEKNNVKKLKIMKKIIVGCVGILVLELILMFGTYIYREIKINYQDGLNDIQKIDEGYIAVGYSNFRNSATISKKTYTYTKEETKKETNIVANQAKIVKYDDDMNMVWESTFPCEYDSTFYSVLEVEDGYIAVGSYIYEYEQIDLNTRDGLIVKYDKNGKLLWHKNYQVLGDTEFFNIIESDGKYIVVGQSIYENMEIGNHTNGGGIILRYDKEGNLLDKNNYGGNKSGIFNDIIEVSDGYVVCGGDAGNYGIVVKFKKDFNREENDHNLISKKIMWQRTYSNTDYAGFTNIFIKDNKLYVSGAINVSNIKDEKGNTIFQYDAGIIVYDAKTGKKVDDFELLKGSKTERYNEMLMNKDSIIAVGITSSNDVDIKDYPKYETTTGIIVKYDYDGKIIEKNYFGGKNEDIFSHIIKVDDKYLVIGTSNSSRGLLGYDYQTLTNFYNEDLEQIN